MEKKTPYKISTLTATALVVASMIGTGVFTSLGFQLEDLPDPTAVLLLWVIGGLLALSGALSYAEVGTVYRKSGGEYQYLTQLYSPFVGYLAGWISLTVGFAAPVALSAIAVVAYFPYAQLDPVWSSIVLIALITLIHTFNLRVSSGFQNASTFLKVLLIVVLIIVGLWVPGHEAHLHLEAPKAVSLLSASFAIGLIFVSYSYSGWNAASYITEELKDPKRSLVYALIGGTVFVTVLYTLLQYVFLRHVPVSELKGQVDIGKIAAAKIMGTDMGNIFSLGISLLLISGISAMTWVGPRVTAAMARDIRFWKGLKNSAGEIPVRATWLQFLIAVSLLLTGTFEQILIYCGFLLTLSSMLTVLGVFLLRIKKSEVFRGSEVFKGPLFPLFQSIYIVFAIGILLFTFIERPVEASLGSGNILLGGLTWYAGKRWTPKIR